MTLSPMNVFTFCADPYLQKFEEHYSEVVRNQVTVTLKITNCTTIGPPRIGKTCFKHLLTGHQWDVEAGTASTDVMKAPEWVECYSLEEGTAKEQWRLVPAKQQQETLLRAVNQLTIKPSDAPPTAMAKSSDAPPTAMAKLSDAPPTAMAELSDAPPTTTAKPSDVPPTASAKLSDAPPTTTDKPSDDPPTAMAKSSDAPPTAMAELSDAPPTARAELGDAPPTARAKPSDAPPTATAKLSDAPPTATAKLSDASPTATAELSDASPTARAKPSDVPPTATAKLSDAPPTARTKLGDASPTARAKLDDAPPTALAELSDAPPTAMAELSDTTPTAKAKLSDATPTATAKLGDATPRATAKGPVTILQFLQDLAFSQEDLEHLLKDEEGKVLGETRLIHFIDTGGQAIYHDVHPVLITSPSVYLVVFSLSEIFQKKSYEEQLAYFRSDLIQRPLRSIYTFGTKKPHEEHLKFHPEVPIIFIVGTHLDQIPTGNDREKFLASLHEMISAEIGNKPYRQFVRYDPEDRSFWAVDNTQAGMPEQEEGVKRYISKLCSEVQATSMEMSVKVPLPWMLLKLVMDGRGVRYCKYSELLEEACRLGYVREHSPEADLDSMLRLFHILGLIYHKVTKRYKKENSLVFIDPDCLYSATSDLLMAAKEEIENNRKDQHQNLAAAMGQTEDSLIGIEEQRHQTQTVTKEGEELADVEVRQQMLEPGRIVMMEEVIQKMGDNAVIIKLEMETVLQNVKETMAALGQEPTEVVLQLLHTQLKKMGQKYKLHDLDCQEVMSVEDKRQLFIGGLVNSLASYVKTVLHNLGRKRDVHHVRKDLGEAIESMKVQYSRTIENQDMDQFLSILSDLRIVAQMRDMDRYLIPAALPKIPHSETFAGSADSIFVAVVSQTIMQVCYLPSGLFCCLISELVTGLGWTVFPLERTHVAFTHVDLDGKVHLMERESYIEIKLESEASLQELIRAQTCQTVRRRIHEGLFRVYIDLFSDPTAGPAFDKSLVWGFQCEGINSSDEVHISDFCEEKHACWTECLPTCVGVQDVTPTQEVWAYDSLLPLQLTGDVDFRLTKCITIRIQDVGAQGQQIPVENWVQYKRYVTPEHIQCLDICKKSDWKFANNSDILLCIDIPNQQVYPLPLLVAPAPCVYLVVFDLPGKKEEEVLKRIHNTLKELYRLSSHEEPDAGLNEEVCISPKVFLIGLQKEKSERSGFAQQLSHMLKMRSYESLLIFPEGGDPYWSNPGADLNVHGNAALLSTIQRCCCQLTQIIRHSLVRHCELLQMFEGSPFVFYKDVEAKMANVVSGIAESFDVDQFLKVLHYFGLVFYCPLPDLTPSENVVVLQPHCLHQLFEKVQKLSKQRDVMTIEDLLTTTSLRRAIHDKKKWFQAMCALMGLVIEQWCGNQTEYVFVMGLDPECDSPSHASYCVDPLLVAYRPQQFVHKRGDCYLPSPLFPTFITIFLKELKMYVIEQRKDTRPKDPQPIVRKRHHWCVSVHVSEQTATQIHVVERDSFIEIGLLQFHTQIYQTQEQQKEKLQHFCQNIRTIASKSVEDAVYHLRLNISSICYGFPIYHSEKDEAVNCFGEFQSEDNTLVCRCCPTVRRDATVKQQIWFRSVELSEVCYTLHITSFTLLYVKSDFHWQIKVCSFEYCTRKLCNTNCMF